jgi:protoheme IX farnesyltransferase
MSYDSLRAGLVSLKSYIRLFRLRIVALLLFTALVSAVVAADGGFPIDKIFLLVLAGGVASIGSGFLNHYFDRDIDAVMDRTKGRPLPSCEINPVKVLYIGVALIASSLIVSAGLNFLASLFILLGAVVYVAVYTLWLKRRSSLNIVIGGLSGAFAALAGWAAVSPELSLSPILIALVIFLWTPSHFWCFAILNEKSYKKAKIPMLPALLGPEKASKCILANTLILVTASVLLYFYGTFGPFYLIASLALGAIFIYLNIRQVTTPSLSITWKNYKFSGAYLLMLLSAMLVDVYF